MRSLKFGAATSDVVITTTLNSLRMDVCTMLGWFYPTSLTNTRKLFGKWNNPTTASRHEAQVRATGAIRVVIEAGVADLSYETSDNLLVTGKWYFVAVVIDEAAGAGLRVKFYIGTETTLPVATGVTVNNEGTTPYYDSSADTFQIGNDTPSAGANTAWQGSIGDVAIYPRVLTPYDINECWEGRYPANAKGLWFLGDHGTSAVLDVSGNGHHGAITGAVISDLVQAEYVANPGQIIQGIHPW